MPYNEIHPPAGPSGSPADLLGCPWMFYALCEEGVKEAPGALNHKRILEYIATVTRLPRLLKDSTPWCSAFVNWVLRQTWPGRYNGQRARARAWKKYGAPIAPDKARFGDIVVVERGIPGIGGHVGFFVRYGVRVDDKGRDYRGVVILFGGNQGNRVCEATYPASKILYVRRPEEPKRG